MYFQWDFGSIQKGARIRQGARIPLTGCIGPGIPGFVINIPVREVFFNPPIPPPPGYLSIVPGGANINNAATFNIDLYNIQQEVLNSQRN